MTSPHRAAGAAASAALLALALLAGCAAPGPRITSTPTHSRTPSPTPTATGDPVLQKIVIAASGLRALDTAGHSMLELPYSTDAVSASEQISELLGSTATTATVTTDECYPQLDESSWGGLHIFSSPDGLTRPESAQFYATADDESAADGISIESTRGTTVGTPRTQALAADPSAPSFSANGEVDLHYDIGGGSASGDPGDYFGALAVIKDGAVVELDSPIYYSRPC